MTGAIRNEKMKKILKFWSMFNLRQCNLAKIYFKCMQEESLFFFYLFTHKNREFKLSKEHK